MATGVPALDGLLALLRGEEPETLAPAEELRVQIDRHRLAPRLVASGAAAHLPEDLAQDLQAEVMACTVRNLAGAALLQGVFRDLADRGIPAVTFKGPALSQWLHGNVAGRRSKDLDFLVPRHQAQEAMEMLEADGWVPTLTVPPGFLDRFIHQGVELRYLRDGVPLELHWGLPAPRGSDRWLPPAFLENAATLDVAGVALPVPDPFDHLTFLVLHGHNHSWTRLQWLLDIDAWVRRHGVDWESLEARARRRGFLRRLLCTVRVLDDLLSTPVPEGLLVRARRDRHAAWLHQRVLRELATTRDGVGSSPQGYRYQHRSLDTLAQRRSHVRALLRSTPPDWAFVPLPRGLRAGYVVLRPVRLLRHAVRGGFRRG